MKGSYKSSLLLIIETSSGKKKMTQVIFDLYFQVPYEELLILSSIKGREMELYQKDFIILPQLYMVTRILIETKVHWNNMITM